MNHQSAPWLGVLPVKSTFALRRDAGVTIGAQILKVLLLCPVPQYWHTYKVLLSRDGGCVTGVIYKYSHFLKLFIISIVQFCIENFQGDYDDYPS
jgi:hypothetical protein